ncbi:MAG: hypothetical protein ACLUMK_09860 [Christensenellales bacterium]
MDVMTGVLRGVGYSLPMIVSLMGVRSAFSDGYSRPTARWIADDFTLRGADLLVLGDRVLEKKTGALYAGRIGGAIKSKPTMVIRSVFLWFFDWQSKTPVSSPLGT